VWIGCGLDAGQCGWLSLFTNFNESPWLIVTDEGEKPFAVISISTVFAWVVLVPPLLVGGVGAGGSAVLFPVEDEGAGDGLV